MTRVALLALLALLALYATAAAQELPPKMPPPEYTPASPLVTPAPPSSPRVYLPAVWQEAQP
jgi:hypothetical protein